ncbi:MAG: ORC1-type DNA replication protein [Nanoarchaeota archaeon]
MVQKTLKDMLSGFEGGDIIFKDRDVLSFRYTPETVPHRDEQIKHLASIVAPSARGGRISNVFIYGKTGTGKTLVTKNIMNELKKTSDNVCVLFVNCKMKKVSDTEYRLFAELIRNLGEEIPSTGLPTDQVYRRFFELIDSKKQNVILVLDEIDTLVKKTGDDILYNLTRINQELVNTQLSIIGISNDISFTDTMDPRVRSSLSEEEIIFPPYNASQLQDILIQRANLAFKSGAIGPGVIEKCSALAAQEHGDARRALDLLRMAVEISERRNANQVKIEDVDKAEHKLDSDRIVEIVKTQPKQSQAVLASIINLMDSGQKNIQTGDIFSIYEKIVPEAGLKELTQRRITDLIGELDMLGVINARVISKGRYGRTREINMQLPEATMKKIRQTLNSNFSMRL